MNITGGNCFFGGDVPNTEHSLFLVQNIGILHLPVYTFFEKVCIVELNADVETGNLKFEIR